MSNLTGALVGPGSQPEDFDGGKLEYMQLPRDMMVYSAGHIPESEDARKHAAGLVASEQILLALTKAEETGVPSRVDLIELDADNLAFVDQLLGEGEVSVVMGDVAQSQESVLAGVWRVREYDADGGRKADYAEIGAFPSVMIEQAFAGAADTVEMPQEAGPNIFNAPPLITEINEYVAREAKLGDDPHVINLSLLPHTEEDLAFLDETLGKGSLVILSRGYGNCRINATKTRNVWWVRFFNSQDTLILNSIEVCPIPSVALAAAEDIADSRERLSEILDSYR
ncbi:hydrogenase expression/formation protein [Erythrobacter sp. SCSIO 43205]|uniref:hydrogenase expression/formation protein n=1 Tax=Erythrobacter sp. SCSIO 43205 TaxID=2779361 RepID=UPI001CAA0992|nr:hydrogenase expression/formation protein [Erythrobacter sp. SCSIO 43205]UAB77847.1 hydrogenase expression/formation protein [Erythrobacter sp. SCSIO 43205]